MTNHPNRGSRSRKVRDQMVKTGEMIEAKPGETLRITRGAAEVIRKPKYRIELQRERTDYATVTVDAADYVAAEQEALRMARDGEIDWKLGEDADEADVVDVEYIPPR